MIKAEDIIIDVDTVANEETVEPISPLPRTRLLAFQIMFILGVVILVGGLWYLQFVEGAKFQKISAGNMLRVLPVLPNRGVIYDRNNVQLVMNKPSYTIAITPYALPKDRQQEVLDRLQRLTHISITATQTISQAVTDHRNASAYVQVPVATKVDRDLAMLIAERRQELPGVVVQSDSIRQYLTGDIMTHILGYVGRISQDEYQKDKESADGEGYTPNDTIGKTGLELSYEPDLRGRPGQEIIEVNSTGVPVRTLDGGVAAVPGRSLRLSIDLQIQKKMMELARQESEQGKHGVVAIVIMNPQNGQLISLADWPSFDNNFFSGDISEANWKAVNGNPLLPLINHAISSQYPPGSSFKIINAAAGLYYGVINKDTLIDAQPVIYVPNQYYPNRWDLAQRFVDPGMSGPQNVVDALGHSSNTFFYEVAGGDPNGKWNGLGYERLGNYAKLFTLGGLTGIDLPDEVTGIIPDEEWKKEHYGDDSVWTKGDTYLMGIGQGYVTATPIQMAVAVSAIANGGTIYEPQIVQDILDENGRPVSTFHPKVIRQLPNTIDQINLIREGMRKNMVWNEGQAVKYNVPEIYMAGKTGTAEYGDTDENGNYKNSHGWFVTYASRNENTPPEYAVCVFVEVGKGATDGARIAQKVMRYLYNIPEPDPNK